MVATVVVAEAVAVVEAVVAAEAEVVVIEPLDSKDWHRTSPLY